MRKLFLFGFLTILLFSCHRKEEFENEYTGTESINAQGEADSNMGSTIK